MELFRIEPKSYNEQSFLSHCFGAYSVCVVKNDDLFQMYLFIYLFMNDLFILEENDDLFHC